MSQAILSGKPANSRQIPDHSIMDHYDKQLYLGNQFSITSGPQSTTANVETPLLYINNPFSNSAPQNYLQNMGAFLKSIACSSLGTTALQLKVYLNPVLTSPGQALTPKNLRPANNNTSDMLAALLPAATTSAESTTVAFIDDVGGSLAGKYFFLSTVNADGSVTENVIWYKVGGQGSAPDYPDLNLIEVDINEDDTASDISTATYTALSGQSDSSITWTNLTHVEFTGPNGALDKNGGVPNTWDASAFSNRAIENGGSFSFNALSAGSAQAWEAGLSSTDPAGDPAAPVYSFGMDSVTWQVIESGGGGLSGTFPYQTNDLFEIRVSGTTVEYYQNDVLMYTSLVPFSGSLYPCVVVNKVLSTPLGENFALGAPVSGTWTLTNNGDSITIVQNHDGKAIPAGDGTSGFSFTENNPGNLAFGTFLKSMIVANSTLMDIRSLVLDPGQSLLITYLTTAVGQVEVNTEWYEL